MLNLIFAERRNAHVAQLVERILGKDEVVSSILTMSSTSFSIPESGCSAVWERT